MIPFYKKDVRVSGCIRAAWGACPLLTLFRCRLQLRCWIGEPCSHNPTPSLRQPFAKVAFGYRRSACWAAYSQQDLKPLARSKAPPPPLCARYSLFGSPHEVLPRAIPARGRLASREMSSSSLLATWDFQVEMPQMFAAHGLLFLRFRSFALLRKAVARKNVLRIWNAPECYTVLRYTFLYTDNTKIGLCYLGSMLV